MGNFDQIQKQLNENDKKRDESSKKLIEDSNKNTKDLVDQGRKDTEKTLSKGEEIFGLTMETARSNSEHARDSLKQLLDTSEAGNLNFKTNMKSLGTMTKAVSDKVQESFKTSRPNQTSSPKVSLHRLLQVYQNIRMKNYSHEETISYMGSKGVDINPLVQYLANSGQPVAAAETSSSMSIEQKVNFIKTQSQKGISPSQSLQQLVANGENIDDVVALFQNLAAQQSMSNGAGMPPNLNNGVNTMPGPLMVQASGMHPQIPGSLPTLG